MRKQYSLLRKEYRRAYSWLRFTKGSTHYRMFDDLETEVIYCALETYDYYDSEFSGWINRRRMAKFKTHTKRTAFLSELPF